MDLKKRVRAVYMSIRVLHIVPRLNCGGVEKALLDLSTIWKNYDMDLFYVVSSGGSMVSAFQREGAVVIDAPVHTKNPFLIVKNIFTLRKIVKKHKIDLIHVHSRAPAWSAFFVKSVPFVATYHGLYKDFSTIKSFYNSIMLRGKYVVAVSKFIQEHIKNMEPKAEIVLIPQGVDTNYFSRNNKVSCKKLSQVDIKYRMILCPGRLSWTKGQDVLLKSLKTLPSDLSIIFVGDGKSKYKSYLKSLASTLQQDIHFVSSVFDLRPWYERAEIVVVPSVVPESFGRVCLESMAMEVPFIGTTIGATREVSSETAFLCPPNHPKALAQAIFTVLNFKKKDKESLTKKARMKAVSSYSLDSTMNSLKKVYESCL